MPVSLLASITETSAVFSDLSSVSSADKSRVPLLWTRIIVHGAAWSTAGCSIAEARMRSFAKYFRTVLLPSVAPELKMIWAAGALMRAAIWSRARSTILRACRPKLWTEEALSGLPCAVFIRAMISAGIGVVAL